MENKSLAVGFNVCVQGVYYELLKDSELSDKWVLIEDGKDVIVSTYRRTLEVFLLRIGEGEVY